MPDTPITRSAARGLVKLVLIGFAVQLVIIGYVFFQAYANRVDVVNNQRKACARGKLDRTDNAQFQTAQRDYIDRVVIAKSVKQDVKDAAGDAVKVFNRTSGRLTRRSKISCEKAFPSARIFP